MALQIDCKTLEGAYEKINEKLGEKDYTVLPFKRISYGIQFEVSKNKSSGLIRVFSSDKKGVRLDLSQIKDKSLEEDVMLVFGYSQDENDASMERTGEFHSLCIGINDFDSRMFRNLKYAQKDAEKLHELVIEKFEETKSKNICLTNREATRDKIIEALNLIKSQVKKEDTVMIFVASHGEAVQVNGGEFEYYIIPSNIDDNSISKSAISMSEIRSLVSSMNSDRKIVFLDTCYSGGISRRDKNRVSEYAVESLFKQFTSENFVMICSSQPEQVSYECHRIQQGVFTHFLLRGLTGNIQSTKGEIDLYTLYLFLNKSVNDYAEQYFKAQQKPKFFGSISGPFSLPLLKNITHVPEEKKFSFEKINCIGIDESGKGDYFGPLVVAAVYVDTEEKINKLKEIGIKDSKKIQDSKIRLLAKRIKEICDNEVIAISPTRYNQLWETMLGLNEILAWSHAQSLEKVLQRNTNCDMAISDQFSGKEILLNKLKSNGKKIELIQRTKAEENVAVAAASILARDRFLEAMEIMERTFNQSFHRGANDKTIADGVLFTKKGGNLREVAKIHFSTTEKISDLSKEVPIIKSN